MPLEYLKITANREIKARHHVLELAFPQTAYTFRPGQFIMVQIGAEDHLVPRPFSVLNQSPDSVQILFKIFGEGTRLLSLLKAGQMVRVLWPLGNAFPMEDGPEYALIAGGIGVVPLYFFAKTHRRQFPDGAGRLHVFLGAATGADLVYQDAFRDLGCAVYPATMDGSVGWRGSCLDLFQRIKEEKFLHTASVMACGPHGLLKAIARISQSTDLTAYVATEEVMGCGFGACVGCVIPCRHPEGDVEYKLVCRDGPVFNARDLALEPL